MKNILLISFLLLIVNCGLYSQTESFQTELNDFYNEVLNTENQVVLDMGGNFTSSESVIVPVVQSFTAKTRYMLIVLIDQCNDCDLKVQFVTEDGTPFEQEVSIEKKDHMKMGLLKFSDAVSFKGRFEIFVDSQKEYYTYFFLVEE